MMPRRNREFVRKGDFLVPVEDLEDAEEAFEERSERSQALDRSLRAGISTDVETYKKLKGRGVDYPGVDTPTDSPERGINDPVTPGQKAKLARGEELDIIIDEQPHERPPGHIGDVLEASDEFWRSWKGVYDSFRV